MSDFAVGATAVGALASIYFYIYLVMQIPTGILADTIGPRKTVFAGACVVAFGSLVFALAQDIETAFIGRFLVGLGASVAFICTLKIQAIWFKPKVFATMMGLLTLVGTFASISAATPLAFLSQKFGWSPIFIIAAFLSLLSAGFCFFVPENDPPSKSHQDSLKKNIPIVWRNPQTWLCSLIHFAFLGSYLTFIGLWGVPFLMQGYGLERVEAANWMIIFAVSYTLGAFFFAALSDRWLKVRKAPMVIASMMFIMGVGTVLFWPNENSLAVILAAFLVVCFASSANVICFATVQESNPKAASGLAMATANGGILCVAILQPLVGYILDSTWSGAMFDGVRLYSLAAYKMGFVTFLVVGIIALVSSLVIKETNCESIY